MNRQKTFRLWAAGAALLATALFAPRKAVAHCDCLDGPVVKAAQKALSEGNVKALAKLRQLTGNDTLPPDACPTFKALYEELQQLKVDLHQHVHLENNVLFPCVLAYR